MFGVGALVVALGVFPLMRWLPGDSERRAQWLVHLAFRGWIRFATLIGLFRVHWQGRERLPSCGPAIVVANHPTLIDVVLLMASLPQADCVVKGAAWRNPFLRWVVAGAGYIRNDGGATLIDSCVLRVRQGRCLVLFPEGTRSPARSLGALQRGAAHVALRAAAPMIPVTITCEPPTLMKGQPWYCVPDRIVAFTIAVAEPIWPASLRDANASEALAARQVMDEMQRIYEGGLTRAGA